MRASLAAACLGDSVVSRKGLPGEVELLGNGLDAAELFTFRFLSFSAARNRLRAHSNFYVQDRSLSACLVQSPGVFFRKKEKQ